jgi:hypothetical protein
MKLRIGTSTGTSHGQIENTHPLVLCCWLATHIEISASGHDHWEALWHSLLRDAVAIGFPDDSLEPI